MPEVRIHTLSNGCKVILRPTPNKDILSIVAGRAGGTRVDAPTNAGASYLMARLLVKGTQSRNALEVAETLEDVGGSIDAFCDHDAFGLETQTVSEDWRVAVDVLTDCLFRPAFDPLEFEKERVLVQAEIRRAEDNTFGWTYRRWQELFYRDHPYGIPAHGTKESVAALSRDPLPKMHAERVRPDEILISVAGNVPEEDFLKALEQHCPDKPETLPSPPAQTVASPGAGQGETLTFHKEVEQTFIISGYPAPPMGSEESTAMRVACGILGEGMSARLFQRLRDRDHLAYAVGSSLAARDWTSHLITFIGTSPKTAEKARKGLAREVELLLKDPPEEPEIERARRYIKGKHLLGRQTNSALAHSMFRTELRGLGWNWPERLPERIDAVTGKKALAVVEQYLKDQTVAVLSPEATD